MGIGVLVIVSAGQRSQLPLKPLAAGVIFAGLAPAIATPIAKGLYQRLQVWCVGKDGPAFSSGYTVAMSPKVPTLRPL
jgi:hypothetical protein